MNVNIYYGGRGLVDDPNITVLNKITDVLNELRVNVEKCKYGRMVWDRRLYASVP